MIDQLTVDTIRFLSVDMVEQANSGHPGLPLGAAPMAYALWKDHLSHNPQNPDWVNRDRFVLSAGHGSALLYSLLHLFGYELSIDDLTQFRKLHSKTPGHPEFGYTQGVEATTGPLGQGIANAVGMAMAEKHLSSIFNTTSQDIIHHFTYALCGEGCLMEGVSGEASSLAGTLELGKLIVLFDSNNITIDGRIDIAFSENVKARYESYHWQVLEVAEGTDIAAISKAIATAKMETSKPTMIIIRTKIGHGSPVADSSAAHGSPISKENILQMKKSQSFPPDSFFVPEAVYTEMSGWKTKAQEKEAIWKTTFKEWSINEPELLEKWNIFFSPVNQDTLLSLRELWEIKGDVATRTASGKILNIIAKQLPQLFGGSADLAGSNNTFMENSTYFSSHNPMGNNIHFGVREHAMTAIANGIMLHGGLKPFIATFLVFSDYMKPALRLSALMKLPVISILTHDSIGVGEDGPTHQPIEQLVALRSIPDYTVIRPADNNETAAAWVLALSRNTPTGIILTRQNLPQLELSSDQALLGGYIVKHALKDEPDALLIATGSEVHLAIEAADKLEKDRIFVQVVSMPSREIFEEQSPMYQASIIPPQVTKRVVIEAASTFGWEKYAGDMGRIIGMHSFGESAPGYELFEYFNITTAEIIHQVKEIY